MTTPVNGGGIGETMILTCAFCRGEKSDPRFADGKGKCPVCRGKGLTAHRWEGNTFVILNPDDHQQRTLL